MLRDKYQAEWPFTWQETQDMGQQNISFAKENSITQKTMVLFLRDIFDGHVPIAIMVSTATTTESKC